MQGLWINCSRISQCHSFPWPGIPHAWLYYTSAALSGNDVFVERAFGSRPCSVQLHGTCRIDSESLCVTRPSVQHNCCRPDELDMHRKWWHNCCRNAPTEIRGENEGKQHVGASWGQMAVLSLWDNVGMGDKICSDGKSWYVIRISLLDSHYATKRQF